MTWPLFRKREIVCFAVVTGAIFVLLLGLLTLLAARVDSHIRIRLGDQVFIARVAATDVQRQRGLSGTTRLEKSHGLLLIFSDDARWSIWMKDMNYPIDVVWLNKAKQVVGIETNLQPSSYPKTFASTRDARYVLELPAGTVKSAKISVDKTAVWSDNKT